MLAWAWRTTMPRQPHQHSNGIVIPYTQGVDRLPRIFDPYTRRVKILTKCPKQSNFYCFTTACKSTAQHITSEGQPSTLSLNILVV